MGLFSSLVGSVIYLLLFIGWRALQPEGILFYQGLVLAVVVAFAQAVIHKMLLPDGSAVKDAVITLLICYSFMFTIPTTVERAYSVKMIIELSRHTGGLSRSEIEDWFVSDFTARGGVEKRLYEQTATGSLVESEDRFYLTPFGHFLASSFHFVQRIFTSQATQP